MFRYDYLPGSGLLHSLTHPNGVTLMQTYEAKRDLITEMLYINGNQTAASRRYEYDSMGRPTTRYQQQEERKQRDSFEYNAENRPVRFTRIEGTSTTVVECAYDTMGRRATKKVTVNGDGVLVL